MSLSLSEFISHHQSRIETHLSRLLDTLLAHDTPLIEAMRYSLLDGGKRFRPLLCYAAAQSLSTNPSSTNNPSCADDFASALECVHVYSLIHDDLPAMDDDALRRGRPTNHIAFNEATAILAGDALQCLAFEIIANSKHADAEQKLAAIQVLGKASGARGMVLGQAIDLAAVDQSLTLEQLENMHRHKTGTLIEAAVNLGAIAAKASHQEQQKLGDYARALGLAFQVQDDILDVVSSTETLGKTQGADQDNNKPTYVSLLGLEQAKIKAAQLRDEAKAACEHLGGGTTTLSALADFVIERKY
ncbi:MAG: polyprenyl synthetase family protein [Agarilytica sp.]